MQTVAGGISRDPGRAVHGIGAKRAFRGVFVSAMRRFLVGLVLVLLVIVSIAVGVTVARWPSLLQAWHRDRGP